MEKVLLFQVQEEAAGEIAGLLAAMKVKCERIPRQAFRRTIGELAKGKQDLPEAWDAERRQGIRAATDAADEKNDSAGSRIHAPEESMMLFCDVGEKHFNKILAQLRARAVRIDYKAVLTPVNREWNVLRLYAELAREKAEYERMRR